MPVYKTSVRMPNLIKAVKKVILPVFTGTGTGVPFSGVRDSIISGNTTTFVDIIL